MQNWVRVCVHVKQGFMTSQEVPEHMMAHMTVPASAKVAAEHRLKAEQWPWEPCGRWKVSAWSQTLSLHSGLIYCAATSRLIQGACVSPNSANERSQQGHGATQGPHSAAQCRGQVSTVGSWSRGLAGAARALSPYQKGKARSLSAHTLMTSH